MAKDNKPRTTIADEGVVYEIRGTGPRQITPRPSGDGKPPGRQPILPKDKAKAAKT